MIGSLELTKLGLAIVFSFAIVCVAKNNLPQLYVLSIWFDKAQSIFGRGFASSIVFNQSERGQGGILTLVGRCNRENKIFGKKQAISLKYRYKEKIRRIVYRSFICPTYTKIHRFK